MPGELIDTNEWYLTLPTGKEGSPDTIEGSKLATYHSKFFDLTRQRDGIVFNAGADGVTTKNSHYPRSELREMNGSEKASWSNTSGTHVFDVREAFTKLPGAKPEVVGVQIHDAEDDVMQIRLEGKKLMVQYHDGKSEAVLDPDYQLGTPVRHPDRRRERQGGRALQRPEEGRAAAVGIGLVLEGRRVRAVERQQGRRAPARPARSWSTRRTSRTPARRLRPPERRACWSAGRAGRRRHRVVQQQRRGHRPDAAGHRRHRARATHTASASTSPTRLPFSSGVVPTSITTAPGADVLGPEHPRPAHRRDEDLRLAGARRAGRGSASGRR